MEITEFMPNCLFLWASLLQRSQPGQLRHIGWGREDCNLHLHYCCIQGDMEMAILLTLTGHVFTKMEDC